MVSKQRRARQLARAHAERQEQRRAAAARRRRWRNVVVGTVLAVLVVVGGTVLVVQNTGGSPDTAAASATATPGVQTLPPPAPTATEPTDSAETTAPSDGPITARCSYRRDGDLAPGVRLPTAKVTVAPVYTATLDTNRGRLTLSLDGAAAPCTVNAFVNLARAGVLEGSECTRLTGPDSGGRFLECGDPAGAALSAGFSIPIENASEDPFAAGTLVAPHTEGGSSTRFRLLYDESELGGRYTVFGTVTSGLDVLKEVADGGLADVRGEEPTEGQPALRTVVESVTVTES